jgi:phosphoribosylamine-glycine ligase
VTGIGKDVPAARARAYAAVKTIRFTGMRYRTDIGSRAFP